MGFWTQAVIQLRSLLQTKSFGFLNLNPKFFKSVNFRIFQEIDLVIEQICIRTLKDLVNLNLKNILVFKAIL